VIGFPKKTLSVYFFFYTVEKDKETAMKTKTIKRRITWGFNPASRVVPSKKRYCRSREKMKLRKES